MRGCFSYNSKTIQFSLSKSWTNRTCQMKVEKGLAEATEEGEEVMVEAVEVDMVEEEVAAAEEATVAEEGTGADTAEEVAIGAPSEIAGQFLSKRAKKLKSR
jgi:hypothetical protein